VGTGIAEMLGIPSVTVAQKIDVDNGKAKVERITADGYEVVETPLPAYDSSVSWAKRCT